MVGAERLVTLVGPGGVGKTTLAMEAAQRDRTGRETAVVTLTSVTDPTVLADVLASRARTTGEHRRSTPGRSCAARVTTMARA